MDIDAYLRRLSYTGPRAPDIATLAALHLAHQRAVPFENLDIGRGVPIVLDLDALYTKIVERGRGGFCYELNGVFAELLRALGYTVTLLSAGVYGRNGFGPEFDHLALRVEGGALEEPFLADVGFGHSYQTPLRLQPGLEQTDAAGTWRLIQAGPNWQVEERGEGDVWTPGYRFTLTPRAFSDFAAMCVYQQTAPESPFLRGPMCSQATPEGQVTISRDRLIITRHGQRTEQPLADGAAVAAALRAFFGIVLEPPDDTALRPPSRA